MENQNTTNDSDYLIIPNPIYDVVFKYLMEDNDSAKIILSTLIGEEIIMLHFEPLSHAEKKDEQDKKEKQEQKIKERDKKNAKFSITKNELKEIKITDPKTDDDIKLLHLDFTATVKLPNGKEELIMIELQKASEPDDIFRFKRYISNNFQKKVEKEVIDHKTKAVKKVKVPIRLIPIFILNFRIEYEINDLLIKTNHIKKGVFTNKNLEKNNEFIDNLTYSIWVVQLPNLRRIEDSEAYKESEYKRKLFQLLKLFDQKSIVRSNEHRIRLIRKIFPGFLDRVIQRLQAADINNPDLEEQMNAEDEYLRALIDRDNKISNLEGIVVGKDKEIEQNKQEIEQKEQEIEQKEQEIEQKEQALKKAMLNNAKLMKELGKTVPEIQTATGLSEEEINEL